MPMPNETRVLLCKNCENHVNASIAGEYVPHNDIPEPFQFTLHECPSCNNPILTVQEGEVDYEDMSVVWGEPTIIYPEQYKKLTYDVPSTIRSSYDEVVKCFTAHAYTASALMCRRTLEALVAEKLTDKITLAKGIQKLKADGLIESHLYEWAEMLRVSGNKAAHDVAKKVSKQDAQDLLDFCHALIEYIFTYKDKFETFKQRIAKISVPDNDSSNVL